MCHQSNGGCAMYEYINNKRNKAMANKIIRITESDKGVNLIMLGAGHLHGADGVLDVLRNNGMNFTEINE
jgi:uncharacterized protein YbaP (TraB family)